MTLSSWAQTLGLLGDAITFLGAILLALGEAGEESRTRQAVGMATAYKEIPDLNKLTIEIEGMIIKKEGDAHIAVARRFSRRALLGARTIAGGFLFLLASRILEMILRS